MKFTDGNWMMRAGVRAHYPAQAYDVETHGQELVIHAPTRHIRHRGDTLEGPLITVRITSPQADVIRVQASHFQGGAERGPEFPLNCAGARPATILSDEFAELTSGLLRARVSRGDTWKIEFCAGNRAVTSSPARGMALAEVDNEGPYMFAQLTLGVGECVYGLGERFTAFAKNGQVVETWNKDGGTGSDQAYKNVPFYLTNRGYGVFVNHPENVSFEVASEKVSRVQFSVAGRSLDYFVIYGPTPAEILRKYTALTGRAALPPAWSFGLWLTTSFTTSYDEETVTSFIEGMAARDLPLHVFHFDCFWMKEFHWCDFQWDERVFPDPAGMLARLKQRGVRICVWINPYIAQRSPLFDEGCREGYLLKRPNGDVWQTDQWQPGMGMVDFTNPEAAKWYASKLEALVNMGVDCFKTDFGERIPVDVAWYNGSCPQKMHNFYSYLYNRTVFELLEEKLGAGEAVVFARSATAGCQRFPVHWGGDCYSNFELMAESLRGGLSLGLSGFGYWSHDIGGFEGTPPPEVYKRWIAFGLLSSHSRLHGSSSYRVPWLYDDEAVEVLQFFTKLKCALMPYLYGAAVQAAETGVPMMRAMMLEFPEDPACDVLDRQYMLGESLLVAPVFSAAGDVTYYVPAGRWTCILTGEQVQGPAWARAEHGFKSLPLLARPNSIVAFGSRDDRPDYDFTSGVTLRVHEIEDGATLTCTVPADPPLTVTVSRTGGRVTAHSKGGEAWKILMAGHTDFESVENGAVQPDKLGAMVTPADCGQPVSFTLRNYPAD